MAAWHYWLDGREKITKVHTRGYRVSMTFEGYTGADLILTPSKEIISQNTIQSHLDLGAVMIQIKHGMDMSASVIDQRLTESLLRMNVYKAQAYQCGLLLTGKFENIQGQLYIDGQRSNISWKAYRGAITAWGIRGGFVYPIIQRNELQDFIDSLGNKLFVGDPFLRLAAPKPRKKFRPQKTFSKGMTLREKARLAKSGPDSMDLRHLLINIDGMSQKTVSGIWKLMEKENLPLNISSFIDLVVAGRLVEVAGIGPKIQEKVRLQLGYGKENL